MEFRVLRNFGFERNWPAVDRIMKTDQIQGAIARDLGVYTQRVWGVRYESGDKPTDYDNVSMFGQERSRPKIADYTFFCCEERLINVQLLVAQAIRPKQLWRIVVSDWSCTVWDGASMLFDFHAYALGMRARSKLELALDGKLAVVGRPGDLLVLDRPESWWAQQSRELAEQRRAMRRTPRWTDRGLSGTSTT